MKAVSFSFVSIILTNDSGYGGFIIGICFLNFVCLLGEGKLRVSCFVVALNQRIFAAGGGGERFFRFTKALV